MEGEGGVRIQRNSLIKGLIICHVTKTGNFGSFIVSLLLLDLFPNFSAALTT